MKDKITLFGYNFSIKQVYYICVLFFAFLSLMQDFIVGGCLCDTIEHIRASLAVSKGMTPYVDFFEHHHPLLWYLLSPFAQMLYLSVYIVPVFRVIGTLVYFTCIYMVYKIGKKLYNKETALLSTFILISVPALWFDICNLRPDSFMLLAFLIGIKYFLDYLDTKKAFDLAMSYFSVAISFLFLQKAALLVFVFGVYNLYAVYRKIIKQSHFILACFIGATPLLICLLFLLYKGMLRDFVYYNYTFNVQMQSYYDGYSTGPIYLLEFLAFMFFVIVVRTYRFSFQNNIILLCFLVSGCSLILFAPHTWYYIPYFTFASLLLSSKIAKYKSKNVYTMLFFLFICSIYIIWPSSYERNRYTAYIKEVETAIKDNIYDDMLDFRLYPINIFASLKNFYWFGFQNIVIVDEVYNSKKHFDPMQLIKTEMPKYIAFQDATVLPLNNAALDHTLWFAQNNNQILSKARKYPQLKSKLIYISPDFWQIDTEWIKEHYTQTEYTEVYKRNY